MKLLSGLSILALLVITSCNFQSQALKEEVYPNGNIKRQYRLNGEGLITGLDSIFRIDGTLKKVSKWKDGRLVDSIIKYDYDGNISTIGKLQGDKLIFYRKDGTKESEVGLLNGMKDGLKTYYSLDETIIGFKGFKNNEENGILIHLNKNQTPKYIKQLNVDKSAQVLMSHYDDGLLKSFKSYDDLDDGYRLLFYPNGVIKEIGEIKKGEANGLKFFFADDGELIKKSQFKNGDLVPSL